MIFDDIFENKLFVGTTVKGLHPSQAIAVVSSASYLGVLVGPPLFGGLATALNGLRWSLILDGALMFLIFYLACRLPSRAKLSSMDADNA